MNESFLVYTDQKSEVFQQSLAFFFVGSLRNLIQVQWQLPNSLEIQVRLVVAGYAKEQKEPDTDV
jgi:hypothetical protein